MNEDNDNSVFNFGLLLFIILVILPAIIAMILVLMNW